MFEVLRYREYYAELWGRSQVVLGTKSGRAFVSEEDGLRGNTRRRGAGLRGERGAAVH